VGDFVASKQRLIRQSQVRGAGDFSTLEAQLNFMITTSSSYVFHQDPPSAEWVITHSLNRFPKVTLISTDGEVIHAHIQYDSKDQVTVRFSEPVAGQALLQYIRTYNYTHIQDVPAIQWKIQHNLNRIAEVTVVSDSGVIIYPHIRYQSPDIILATFSEPTTGIAYIQ
jgi:hypothetical protein